MIKDKKEVAQSVSVTGHQCEVLQITVDRIPYFQREIKQTKPP